MREPDARAAPRLRFTKEEIQAERIENLSEKTKRAMKKAEKSKPAVDEKRQSKSSPSPLTTTKRTDAADEKSLTILHPANKEQSAEPAEETVPAAPVDSVLTVPDDKPRRKKLKSGQKKNTAPRLHFDDLPKHRTKKTDVGKEKKTPAHLASDVFKPIGRGVKEETVAQLSKYEDDNTGLQAAHTAEQAGSSVLHTGKQVHELRLNRLRHRNEKESTQAVRGHGLGFTEAETGAESAGFGKGGSNPLSRQHQKKNIQRDYHAAKSGKKAGQTAGKTGREAAQKASSATEKVMEYAGNHKYLLVILLLGGVLLFGVQGLSGSAPLLEAGFTALSISTYPAEEADVWAAEQYYAELEWELQDEMQRYALYHPGYDEYVVDVQEIWHDPYALIALISAYNNGEEWTLDDAIPIMRMFFDWQYEKTETVTSVQRYHTETVNGEPTQVWYTVAICNVTLKNKNLSHAPVYTMTEEQVGMYALYMSTHGNMDGLFHGPHVSELKDPLEYDVPQELLDADPKFALLVEEANKRLGYPYVWGGHTPDTSFDCSGFISWIFTETGVRNIGHMSATGLYEISQHITEAELKPGDVIFFSGTIEGETGITHCGLYVGNGMMVHSGSPCSYYDIAHGSLKNNIAGYGRLYQH